MAAKRMHLRVVNPWGDRKANELITDPEEVSRILAGPHQNDVLRVVAEPDPEPASVPGPQAEPASEGSGSAAPGRG